MNSRYSENDPAVLTHKGAFPSEYPIIVSDKSLLAFGGDRHAFPPLALRREVWNATTGQEILAERQRLANAANDELARKDLEAVAEVDRANLLIEKNNARASAEYKSKLNAYTRRMEEYERYPQSEDFQNRLEIQRMKIRETVNAQREAILETVQKIQGSARRKVYLNDYLGFPLRIIALFVWLIPIASVVASLIVRFHYWRALATYLDELNRQAAVYSGPNNEVNVYMCELRERRSNEWCVPVYPYAPLHDDWFIRNSQRETIDFTPVLKEQVTPKWMWIALTPVSVSPLFNVVYYFVVHHDYLQQTDNVELTNEWVSQICERRIANLLAKFDASLNDKNVIALLTPGMPPVKPSAPQLQPKQLPPNPPSKVVAEAPELPADFYQAGETDRDYDVLRGSIIHPVESVRALARHAIFSGGFVQSFVSFCGVPTPFLERQQSHIMCLGTSGSGKTTIMKSLMSALLPLTPGQEYRIELTAPREGGYPMPATSHEWSRSFTFQAVVYNAKKDHVPLLSAFGFNVESNLFIMDPADSRCTAWDVAADVNDRDSIDRFAEMLVPVSKEHSAGDGEKSFWEEQARRVIQAAIISLRNAAMAAGKHPHWNLRDLVNAVATRETLANILRFHDHPESVQSQLLDLSDAQASSIFMSASTYIERFRTIAQRWDEAERQGRKISFKDWMRNHPGSVLLLPNTESNPSVNAPLNRAMFNALTELAIRPEYSRYRDESGNERVRKRCFFMDELASAGRLPDLQSLLTQGRDFGVQVISGVQQLSHLRTTYGEQTAETLLGLNAYMALLKTGDPTTAQWMSKRVGRSLHSYSKDAFTFGTVDGHSFAKQENWSHAHSVGTQRSQTLGTTVTDGDSIGDSSSNGTTRGPQGAVSRSASHARQSSHTESTARVDQATEGVTRQVTRNDGGGTTETGSQSANRSNTRSTDLREEAAVLESQFQNLPDPATAGVVCAYAISPSYPIWRAEIPFEELAPQYDFPARLKTIPTEVPWGNDEQVSRGRAWDEADLDRLCLNREPPDGGLRKPKQSIEGGDEGDAGPRPLEADFDL